MGSAQVVQLPLVSLCQLLLMSPEEKNNQSGFWPDLGPLELFSSRGGRPGCQLQQGPTVSMTPLAIKQRSLGAYIGRKRYREESNLLGEPQIFRLPGGANIMDYSTEAPA